MPVIDPDVVVATEPVDRVDDVALVPNLENVSVLATPRARAR